MAQPEPVLVLFKNDVPIPDEEDHCLAVIRDSHVLIKIDSAQVSTGVPITNEIQQSPLPDGKDSQLKIV